MNGRSLIKQLVRTYGIAIDASEKDYCSLAFDEDDVDFELTDRFTNLIAEIGVPAYPDRFHKMVLAANFDKEETQGAFFGLDENYGNIVLVKILPPQMDYAEFENQIAIFLKVLRRWKEALKLSNDESSTSPLKGEMSASEYETLIPV